MCCCSALVPCVSSRGPRILSLSLSLSHDFSFSLSFKIDQEHGLLRGHEGENEMKEGGTGIWEALHRNNVSIERRAKAVESLWTGGKADLEKMGAKVRYAYHFGCLLFIGLMIL